jgi:hypothetical protein
MQNKQQFQYISLLDNIGFSKKKKFIHKTSLQIPVNLKDPIYLIFWSFFLSIGQKPLLKLKYTKNGVKFLTLQINSSKNLNEYIRLFTYNQLLYSTEDKINYLFKKQKYDYSTTLIFLQNIWNLQQLSIFDINTKNLNLYFNLYISFDDQNINKKLIRYNRLNIR